MKVFIDTAPFIYLIEGSSDYAEAAKNYFTTRYAQNDPMVTSVITLAEYGVNPAKLEEPHLIDEFRRILYKLDIALVSVEVPHAVESYKLRAKYKFLKGMDALQLGIAASESCTAFLTNDLKLVKIEEMDVILLKDAL